jgi:hypothetical protein
MDSSSSSSSNNNNNSDSRYHIRRRTPNIKHMATLVFLGYELAKNALVTYTDRFSIRDSLDNILHSSKVASNLASNMAHLPSKPLLNKLKHIKPFFGLSSKRNSCTT